jgi:hypothetical protein
LTRSEGIALACRRARIQAQGRSSFEGFEGRGKALQRKYIMKTHGQHKAVARIVGQAFVLTTLFAVVLSAPGIVRAQSKPATHLQAWQTAGEPSDKGSQEGFTLRVLYES